MEEFCECVCGGDKWRITHGAIECCGCGNRYKAELSPPPWKHNRMVSDDIHRVDRALEEGE